MGTESPRLHLTDVTGDLLKQPVQALVNPWNRNFVPRWLLQETGVTRQLQKRTGRQPWRDLARVGILDVGQAVVTGAGDLQGPTHLIHVAGLHAYWRASDESVSQSARNAVLAAASEKVTSIAIPLIGAGAGGLTPARSREAIQRGLDAFAHVQDPEDADITIRIVKQGARR